MFYHLINSLIVSALPPITKKKKESIMIDLSTISFNLNAWTIAAICIVAIGAIIAGILALLCLLKLYVYVSTGVCKSKASMNGKTVIVTGCTSGIGKETARDLAQRGARLIMACRNVEAANIVKGKCSFFFPQSMIL